MGQRVFWYILSEGKVTPVSRQSLPSHRHATGAGLFKCHDIISYESRSALICSSCSCVTTSWLNWTAGLSLSQANTLAAAEAKSLSLPLQFRFVAPSCSAACSDALAVACAKPVLVLPSSSSCVAISTSPGFVCKSRAGTIPGRPARLGKSQL